MSQLTFNSLYIENITGPLNGLPQPYSSFNTTSFDSFGRLRVSNPFTLFDSSYRYKDNDKFDTYIGTGATGSLNSDSSMYFMTVSNTGGSSVIRQSYRVFPYQPGKSLLTYNTFCMNTEKENLVQRVGNFSSSNGIFLEQNNSDTYIVLRTSSSGPVTDLKVSQENWNYDKLNGSGPSGLILDMSKVQIFFIDFEWLGVGSVRTGFLINGSYIIANIFEHANIITQTYMTSATLPVRYEIFNNGNTNSYSTLKQICSTVISEGGFQETSKKRYITNGTTGSNISNVQTPVMSIRLRSDRLDAIVIPAQLDLFLSSADTVIYTLVYNGNLTGGNWYNYNTDTSNVEVNLDPVSISGGNIVDTQFISSSNQVKSSFIAQGIDFNLQIGKSLLGVSDTITVCAQSFVGNATLHCSFGWYELN